MRSRKSRLLVVKRAKSQLLFSSPLLCPPLHLSTRYLFRSIYANSTSCSCLVPVSRLLRASARGTLPRRRQRQPSRHCRWTDPHSLRAAKDGGFARSTATVPTAPAWSGDGRRFPWLQETGGRAQDDPARPVPSARAGVFRRLPRATNRCLSGPWRVGDSSMPTQSAVITGRSTATAKAGDRPAETLTPAC